MLLNELSFLNQSGKSNNCQNYQNGKSYVDKTCQKGNHILMNLKEIRKQNGLTQKDAAKVIGIPYRTYIRYEECEHYSSSYKYQKIVSDLLEKTKIDENNGVLSIEFIKNTLVPILEKHQISLCYLFGSYAKGNPKENSDVDLLVDTSLTGMKFFNLVEEMRVALHKKIDLLRLIDLENDNPIAIEILKDGKRLL